MFGIGKRALRLNMRSKVCGNIAPLSLSIAVFSDATSFKTKRRDFFQRLRNQADHVVKVESTPENKLSFTREKNTPLLPA